MVIVGMRADPEPIDRISFAEPDGSIVEANPYGVHRLRRVNLSKAEARVVWIGSKTPIRGARLVLDALR